MKKFIIVLLILSLITLPLSSCKKEKIIEKPVLEQEVTLESESELSTIGIYLPTEDYLRMDEQHLILWGQQLSELSNVAFNISYIDAKLDEKTMIPFSQGLDKLVYINSQAMLDELIKLDLILPLNTYLEEIETSENIEKAYYELYTNADGIIYALPAFRNVNYIGVRSYNANWLATLNANVPSTIDEFTELAIKIRDSSIGSNYREAYIADFYSYYSFIWQFFDVFLAFGCRPSMQSINISYIEEKNEYEDMALTNNFREALTYLKYLEENDLIINTVGLSSEEKEEKYDIGWTVEDPLEIGLYLAGESKTRLLCESIYPGGFAVLKDCKAVNEKLSFLINRVYIDEDILESINYGVRGYNFDENDDYYYYLRNDDNSWRPFQRMHVNIINDIRESKPIYFTQEEYLDNKENYDILFEKQTTYSDLINSLKSTNPEIIYKSDTNKELPIDLDDVTEAINDSFNKLIQNVFKENLTVDEAIDIYQHSYITNGYKEYFDELNGY